MKLSTLCALVSLLPATSLAQSKLVKDVHAGPVGGTGTHLAQAGGRVYFEGNDGSGAALWTSDGTAAGTKTIKSLRPGSGGGAHTWLTALGSKIVFAGATKTLGSELFVSDGTAAGTKLLKDIRPGVFGSGPRNLAAIADRIYFGAAAKGGDFELWATDGTPAGTKLVKDIHPLGGSDPASFTPLGDGRFVFSAKTSTSGRELWVSDGSTAGTKLVKDIYPGAGFRGSDPDWLVALDGKVYFSARATGTDFELWRTDGTKTGTVKLTALFGDAPSTGPRWLAAWRGKIWFQATAKDRKTGSELWSYDPKAKKAMLVVNLGPGSLGSNPEHLLAVGSRHLWFTAFTASFGQELWQTDGTAAGTKLVHDIRTGGRGSFPSGVVRDRYRFAVLRDGRIVFVANDGTHGDELRVIGNGATSIRIGRSCGSATRTPTLSASDPVLGKTMTITGGDAMVGSTAYVPVGLPAAAPLALPGGCKTWIDVTAPIVMLDPFKVTAPTWTTGIAIPADPKLKGESIAIQTLYLPTDAPRGYDLTNAVIATVGS